ncbi:TPA: hypothetical protein ACPFI9_003981 [Providencia rettgeri]
MQLLNLFRAHVMHSTTAALKLAQKEVINGSGHKHLDFATKLINVKNENAHCKLIYRAASGETRLSSLFNDSYDKLTQKIEKYNAYTEILSRMEFVAHIQYARSVYQENQVLRNETYC